jgi:ureidoacrylate peracid hydrolase
MHLSSQNAAVIVVDMQNGFCKDEGSVARIGFPIGMLKDAVAPCVRVVKAARRANVPVIFTRYVYRADYADGGVLVHDLMPQLKESQALIAGSWDAAIVDELAPMPQDFIIDKNRPSSFYGTMLETYLNGIGAKRLIVCGVTTNCCVETTVRDASQRDFQTFVVGDAVGELDRARHDMALLSMGILFAKIVTVAEVEGAFAPARGAAA